MATITPAKRHALMQLAATKHGAAYAGNVRGVYLQTWAALGAAGLVTPNHGITYMTLVWITDAGRREIGAERYGEAKQG